LLADGLVEVARANDDARIAVEYLLEAAGLRREGDLPGAAEALSAALQRAPHDAVIMGRLEPLLRTLAQPRRLADALALHLTTLSDVQRQPVLRTLATLWTTELGDSVTGERFAAEARGLGPPPPPPVNIAALWRAVAPELAVPPMRDLLTSTGGHTSDPAEAPPKDGRAEGAVRVFAIDNDVRLLTSIGGHTSAAASPAPSVTPSTRISDHAAAMHALRERIAALPARQRARIHEARVELAHLHRQANELQAARDELNTVLAEDRANVTAWQALVELEEQASQWPAAAVALDELAQLMTDDLSRADMLFRLGEIALSHLGDAERAHDAYLKAIDHHPRHIGTLRRLLDYYWGLGDRQSLIEIADTLDEQEALVAEATSPSARVCVYFSAALIGDQARALRLARTIGAAHAMLVADATVALALRGVHAAELVSAVRFICRAPGPSLAAVRVALLERQQPLLAALATQLIS
jgi:tetratricopeptide (TPR) repeat protein